MLISQIKHKTLISLAVVATSISGCKQPSTVGDIVFADAKFKECVTSVYSAETALTDVIELNCQSVPVSSLVGAEWLTQLKILRMEGPNTLIDLKPVSKLPQFSVFSLYGLSQNLVDVRPLLTAPAFNELYVENGPNLDCAGITILREKLGENYVITSNGICISN